VVPISTTEGDTAALILAAVSKGVAVGGIGVAVGGMGVAVDGIGVVVGGIGVAVGGMGVAVDGIGVVVGGIGVAVGGMGSRVPQAEIRRPEPTITDIRIGTYEAMDLRIAFVRRLTPFARCG
jgi:hypothetical protein